MKLLTKALLGTLSAVLLSASGLITATARGDSPLDIPDSSIPVDTGGLYDQITNQASTANGYVTTYTPIGNPGNAPDTTGYGSVGYTYKISTYEVSNVNVLNARSEGFIDHEATWVQNYGYVFSPIDFFNWYQAANYVNWLNTTEGFHPAYNITNTAYTESYKWYVGLGLALWTPADAGYDANNLYRNKLAKYVLPTENEWYKAAYGKSDGSGYYLYPTASDSPPQPIYTNGNTMGNKAAYRGTDANNPVGSLSLVYDAGGLSSYGTMGQGGNVAEILESAFDGVNDSGEKPRTMRGGSTNSLAADLQSQTRFAVDQLSTNHGFGFRIVSLDSVIPEPAPEAIPEPATYALFGLGAIGMLMVLRRKKTA